jgi:hypothetical protein
MNHKSNWSAAAGTSGFVHKVGSLLLSLSGTGWANNPVADATRKAFKMDTGCGYRSCPCRGVHFISCGGVTLDTDYCVDGQRVRVSKDSRILSSCATEVQIVKLELWLLDQYADYLRWRYTRSYGRDLPVAPFDSYYPLVRR